MKFLAVASLLFASALAVPTGQCADCEYAEPKQDSGSDSGSYPVPGGNSNSPSQGNKPYPPPSGYSGGGYGYPGGYGNYPGSGSGGSGGNGGGSGGSGGSGGGNGGNGGNGGGTGGGSGGSGGGAYQPCPAGLYGNPQCCSADVLGLVALDCEAPTDPLTSAAAFGQACSKTGREARCCLLPVAGQDVLCQKVVGA